MILMRVAVHYLVDVWIAVFVYYKYVQAQYLC